jgi:hypothetical protein
MALLKKSAAALTVALCAPVWAQSAASMSNVSGARSNEGARAMFYWRMQLDGARPQVAQYGLRFDSAPLHIGNQVRSVPLLDIGLAQGRPTLKALGALNLDSSDPEVWKNPWLWIGGGAAIVALLCATGHTPCKDKDGDSGTYNAPSDARR